MPGQRSPAAHDRRVTQRRDLPIGLGSAFRVGEGRAAGASRKRLRARDLDAPFHGVRTRGVDAPERQLVPVLRPGDAFCGPTGARIWGLPLPLEAAEDARVHVSSLAPTAAMRRPGVVGVSRSADAVVLRDGLPVLDPVGTWLTLARDLPWWDLVAAADRIVTGTLRTGPLASVDDLAAAVASRSGRGHVRRLRHALERVRVGSWSRPETLLRLLIVAAALPEPSLNLRVRLADGREAIIDLAWEAERIAIEYDGRWHDRGAGPDRDALRHEELVDAGWLVVHVRAHELFVTPSVLVARLLRRRHDRGAAPISRVDFARMPRFRP